MEEKRKTHTSSAVKNRYNQKHYKVFRASIKPDLYEKIENYKNENNLSNPKLLEKAIELLLEQLKG